MHIICLAHSYVCWGLWITHFAWIISSSLCTPVWHFVLTSANLLGPVCCTSWQYLHTLVVHTLCLDQFYCCHIYTLDHSLFTLGLCTQLHCTVYNCTLASASLGNVFSTIQPWFTCLALIGPLGIAPSSSSSLHLITACWHSPSALQSGLCPKVHIFIKSKYATFWWIPFESIWGENKDTVQAGRFLY